MKKMLSLLLAFSLLGAPAASAADAPSNWAKAEVEAAQAAGLVPALTGSPAYTDAITREQFAELSVQAITVLSPKGKAFFDAAKTQTFSDCDNPAVGLASAAGVVNGTGGGKFEPKQTTNREQIAAMVYRAVIALNADKEYPLGLTLAAPDLAKFSDRAQVSAWATDAMGTLAASGIMNGTSKTLLSPEESCTVEQAILLLYRVYARATGTAEPDAPPQGGTVYYSDYPAVPDFGAFYGIPDSQRERIEVEGTPYYEYSSVELDTERIVAYQALLEQEGFHWVAYEKSSKLFHYRNPAHSDYLLGLQLAGGGVVRIIFYPAMPAVSALRNYPDGPGNVPDLSAATGLTLDIRAVLNKADGAVQYTYIWNDNAVNAHVAAWFDQLLNAGFRFEGTGKTNGLGVWYSADGKWAVAEGPWDDGRHYAVGIFPVV